MSERWSLTIVKANRVSPLGYILCMLLVICQSEIIASDSNSNLIHHACIMAVYNHWTGLVDWTGGLDWWTGLVD